MGFSSGSNPGPKAPGTTLQTLPGGKGQAYLPAPAPKPQVLPPAGQTSTTVTPAGGKGGGGGTVATAGYPGMPPQANPQPLPGVKGQVLSNAQVQQVQQPYNNPNQPQVQQPYNQTGQIPPWAQAQVMPMLNQNGLVTESNMYTPPPPNALTLPPAPPAFMDHNVPNVPFRQLDDLAHVQPANPQGIAGLRRNDDEAREQMMRQQRHMEHDKDRYMRWRQHDIDHDGLFPRGPGGPNVDPRLAPPQLRPAVDQLPPGAMQ